MKYFADDYEDIWAIDDDNNEFVFSYKTLKLEPTSMLDPMWGGVTEEYAKKRMAEIAKAARAR